MSTETVGVSDRANNDFRQVNLRGPNAVAVTFCQQGDISHQNHS